MIRKTKETEIEILIGKSGEIKTDDKILDHMLNTLFFYMEEEASVAVQKWDIRHHLWEDTGITVGKAIAERIDRAKIARFGSAIIPMDDALVLVSMDISRAFSSVELNWTVPEQGFEKSLVEEFVSGLSRTLNATIHIKTLSGKNAHHITEAAFKGLGASLKEATEITGKTKSTKGTERYDSNN